MPQAGIHYLRDAQQFRPKSILQVIDACIQVN
jgi:hypothetical protein